jgi:hypothetical protein
MALSNRSICERCLEKDESDTHIIRVCETIARLRFRHLGHYYQDAPVSNILHFIQCWRVEIEGDTQEIIEGRGARAGLGLSLIHSCILVLKFTLVLIKRKISCSYYVA